MDNRRVAKAYRDRSLRAKVLPYPTPAGLLSKVKRYFSGPVAAHKSAESAPARYASQQNEPPALPTSVNTSLISNTGENVDSNRILSSFFQEKGSEPLSQVEYEGVLSLMERSRANISMADTLAAPADIEQPKRAEQRRDSLYTQKVLRNSSMHDANNSYVAPDYKPVYHTFSENSHNLSRGSNVSMKRVYQFSGLPSPYRTRIKAPNSAARQTRRVSSKLPVEPVPETNANSTFESTSTFKPRSKTANSLLSILDGNTTALLTPSLLNARPLHNPYLNGKRLLSSYSTDAPAAKKPATAEDIAKTVSYANVEALSDDKGPSLSEKATASEKEKKPTLAEAELNTKNDEKTSESEPKAFVFGSKPSDPKPAFNFGTSAPEKPTSAFSFGEKQGDKPAFSFGAKVEETQKPTFGFTKPAKKSESGTEPTKPVLNFGTDENSKLADSSVAKPLLNFGAKPRESPNAFSFGSKPKEPAQLIGSAEKETPETEKASPAFSFEASDVPKPVSFAKADAPKPISFGSNETNDEPKLFGPTPTNTSKSTPAFTFGAKNDLSSKSETTPKPSFNFGAKAAEPKPSISFGKPESEPEEPKSFSFGSKAKEPKPFRFGAESSNPGHLFTNTKAKEPESKPHFGNSTGSMPAFNFGKSTETGKPLQFGSAPELSTSTEFQPAESKPAESKPAESKPAESKPAESKPAESKPVLSFGKSTESAKPAFNFGSSGTDKPAFNFGKSTESAPLDFGDSKITNGHSNGSAFEFPPVEVRKVMVDENKVKEYETMFRFP